MEKFELPELPGRNGSRSRHGRLANNSDRTYLAPLFLRVCCPSCNKYYRIDTRDIRSSEPHFECLLCLATFSFPYPNPQPMKVIAKLLKPSSAPLPESLRESRPMDVKTCPKCAALNAKGSKECRACKAIFAQLEGLPLDGKLGALPSLVKAWQELMQDYDNLTKHVAFVNRCEDLHAIPFALKKYKDLKEAQPQDHIAQEMVYRVLARRFVSRASQVTEHPSVKIALSQVNWRRVGKISPWLISAGLIILGFTHPAWKNLAGVGASLLFITLGMLLFFRGRISVSDFW